MKERQIDKLSKQFWNGTFDKLISYKRTYAGYRQDRPNQALTVLKAEDKRKRKNAKRIKQQKI